jgi:hypothetical protein
MKGPGAQGETMSDEADKERTSDDATPTRRRLLMLGAVSASAVVTIRPALAQTAGSVMNCQIPVPDRMHSGGQWIGADGRLVAPDTPGAVPPAARPFTGDEVKSALQHNGTLPGADYEASRAYTNYIRRLQSGMSGFTCYASLQMPRG